MHSVRISAVVATALFATAAMAAAPVEEARPVPSVATTPDPDDTDADGASGIGTLFYQLQILQDEVRRLQGIVEEQNYRIERLVREQRERYIELDQRLLALRPDAAQPPGADGSDGPASTVPGAVSVQGDAYNRAYAVVTEARQLPPSERVMEYQRALLMFDALIQDHPDGQYTPNAYYWMGELHLATDALEEARQAFAQVTNLYADHAKMPDALYKLGVTYHRLGDNVRALEYLDRVTDEYPDSTQAGLARSYAAELR
ncbi:MAG: tol-pal system protein YbgF [Gammaproteobacteria bacterium]|nr:tol-pal system protein YbgF [Gammaproteobacteria bacterium]